jgi:enamine deaminase RidA (YjgF/YER057c/UK114 family)
MLNARESDGDLILVTWVPDEAEPVRIQAQRAWTEIAAVLDANAAIPLHERVFGGLQAGPCVMSARKAVARRRCEELPLLPTFIEAPPIDESCGEIAGIHVVAARAADGGGDWIALNGRPCGRVVEGRGARFLSFSDLDSRSSDRVAPGAAEAAASSVDRAESVLAAAGWSLGDVCRAWIHLSDAGEAGRGVGASERAVLDRMGLSDVDSLGFPATTSSAGRSLRGGHCALDLVAARPRSNARFERRGVGDPRGATGLRLDAGEFRYVFVSGTASMDAAAASPVAGDFRSQALDVLENVVALLASEGAGLDDIRQATAFVKRPEDAEDFRCLAEVCGLWEVPVVAVRSEMRRDDLLFELDATAALPIQKRRPLEAI